MQWLSLPRTVRIDSVANSHLGSPISPEFLYTSKYKPELCTYHLATTMSSYFFQFGLRRLYNKRQVHNYQKYLTQVKNKTQNNLYHLVFSRNILRKTGMGLHFSVLLLISLKFTRTFLISFLLPSWRALRSYQPHMQESDPIWGDD